MEKYIIKAENISKVYEKNSVKITALDRISFSVKETETVSIMGPSGAGKSTLLHILGLMDKPSTGIVMVDDLENSKSDYETAICRNKTIGFVFQFYNLLPEFTALENIAMPLLIKGTKYAEARKKSKKLLSEIGLASRADHLPGELSGGEQQRIAIARALVNSPKVLIADEPTGNLDTKTTGEIMELIMNLHTDYGFSLIIATHDKEIAKKCSRIIQIIDGKLYGGDNVQ